VIAISMWLIGGFSGGSGDGRGNEALLGLGGSGSKSPLSLGNRNALTMRG
jgi:hypothetical protein